MFFANLKGFNAKNPRHHVQAFEFLNVSAFRHADSCVRKYRFPPRSLAVPFIKKT